MDHDKAAKAVNKLLGESFWLPTLKTNTRYARLQDDHDGTYEGNLAVTFGEDSDAWVDIDLMQSLRFRTYFGGGTSLRTRQALVILAEAIRLDNEEHPRRRPPLTTHGDDSGN